MNKIPVCTFITSVDYYVTMLNFVRQVGQQANSAMSESQK